MRTYKILIFIVSAIGLLGLIGLLFPREGIVAGGIQLQFPHPREFFETDTSAVVNMDTILQRAQLQQKLSRMSSMKDSFEAYTHFSRTSPSRIHYPGDNHGYFEGLFSVLQQARSRKRTVRILHYGDSQIEMDRISGPIRQEFHDLFGGQGPGLLPAIQTIPSATVSQWASGSLSRYVAYGTDTNRVKHRRYGILCQMAALNGNAIIGFKKGYAASAKAASWSNVRLLLGHNNPGFSAELFAGDVSQGVQSIADSSNGLSILTWNLKGSASQGKLVLNGKADIYAIALDGKAGVAVDNVPMRGSSGEYFSSNNAAIYSHSLKEADVALIIMQFGGNAMPAISSAKRAEWYGGVMGKQIAWVKKMHPEAAILFIGPSDMSRNIGGSMQTWPFLPEVRDALKKAALENGAAFWDMYESMGGQNSMPVWVKASPQLAAPDYIHFTPRGAMKISELLINALLNDYQLYKLRVKARNMIEKSGLPK